MACHFESIQINSYPVHPSRQPINMNRSALKDDKEHYLTYTITVRAADKTKG